MYSHKVTFLRHAESDFNLDPHSTQTDCDLSPRGCAQAATLAGHWSLVIVSPLVRARRTLALSQITYDRLEVWPDVREQRTDACDFMHGEVQAQESDDELMERADRVIVKIRALFESDVLIVSHCEFIFTITGVSLHNACQTCLNL